MADRFVDLLLAELFADGQLNQVQERVRVTGEHPRPASPVHGTLASLAALGMVVAVDHGAAQLSTHLVELVAEVRHLVGAVLVAGDDLIDGVNDNGNVILFLRPADQLWRQLVHWHRAAPEVPDINLVQVLGRAPQGRIHILEAVEAGGPVQFQVDVEHPPLGTGEAQPRTSLGDGAAQLNEGVAFAGLAGSGQEHFMALPEDAGNQGRRQLRQVVPNCCHALRVWHIIGDAVHPVPPLAPGCFPDVGRQKELLFAPSHNAGEPGQPGGVAVLPVYLQAVLLTHRIEVVHAGAVFLKGAGLNPHNGMEALAAGGDQGSHRQLQLPDHGVLLLQVHLVRLYQGIAKSGHILVFYALAIQRVKANPRSHVRVTVAQHCPDVVFACAQGVNQLAGGPVIISLGWHLPSVFPFEGLSHIPDVFGWVKENRQISNEVFRGMPVCGLLDLFALQPCAVHDGAAAVPGVDGVLPIQHVAGGALLSGPPAAVQGHLEYRAGGHRCTAGRAVKGFPLPQALARMIARRVAAAPIFPEGGGTPRLLQPHTHSQPLLVIQAGRVNMFQCLQGIQPLADTIHTILPCSPGHRPTGLRRLGSSTPGTRCGQSCSWPPQTAIVPHAETPCPPGTGSVSGW